MHVAEYNTSMQCYLQPIRRMKSCLGGMTMTSQLCPCIFFLPPADSHLIQPSSAQDQTGRDRRGGTRQACTQATKLCSRRREWEVAPRHPDVSQPNSSVAKASRAHSCDFSSFTHMRAHTYLLPLSPLDPPCALGLMQSPDVGSCCTRCANHPG